MAGALLGHLKAKLTTLPWPGQVCLADRKQLPASPEVSTDLIPVGMEGASTGELEPSACPALWLQCHLLAGPGLTPSLGLLHLVPPPRPRLAGAQEAPAEPLPSHGH